MNIVIRADSGTEIGTGHVMRCLTLAKALRAVGHTIVFVCKDHDGNIVRHLENEEFIARLLSVDSKDEEGALEHSKWLGGSQQADARQTIAMSQQYFEKAPDLVVVDHYGIDIVWHTIVKAHSDTTKIFVIDDLADRNHECDYLLDQTFMRLDSDYSSRVPKHCQLMLGTQFALLRPEFALLSSEARDVRRLGFDDDDEQQDDESHNNNHADDDDDDRSINNGDGASQQNNNSVASAGSDHRSRNECDYENKDGEDSSSTESNVKS